MRMVGEAQMARWLLTGEGPGMTCILFSLLQAREKLKVNGVDIWWRSRYGQRFGRAMIVGYPGHLESWA